MTLQPITYKYQTTPRHAWTPNDWADFWRYDVGVNVIPATNKHDDTDFQKKPFWTDEQGQQHWISWARDGYQTMPISEEQHQEWKDNNAFKDGMAIICGEVFHNEIRKGLWVNGIDCDNKLGVEEYCGKKRDGTPVLLEEIAKDTIVEQHSNKEKCHIITYTDKPIQSQAPLQGDNIPKIEIKSGGNKLLYCAGGIHKDGSLIDIVGSEIVTEVPKDKLENKLNNIFKKYGLEYLKSDIIELSTFQKPVYDVTEKIHEGSDRGGHILSYLDSKKIKNPELTEDDLFYLGRKYERENCVGGSYTDSKMRGLTKQAYDYGMKKIVEHNQENQHQPNSVTKNKNIIDETATLIKEKNSFVTMRKTNEILMYDGKRYNSDAAANIIKEKSETLIENCTTHESVEVLNKIKRQTGTDLEDFDNDPNVLTLPNGILKMDELELTEHTPDNLSRVLIPVEYHKPQYEINDETIFDDIERNLKDTLFWKFLKSSFTVNGKFKRDNFETILEETASFFVKHQIDEKAFMNLGGGENGKSVYTEYVESLLGRENVEKIQLQDIAGDKFMCAKLEGKLANIFADLESDELKHTGKIKNLVSGEGIEVQHKYMPPFKLYPFCKLMFSCNRFPKVYDQTQGFFRRWIIIPWERGFEGDPERDEHLKDKLKSNQAEKNLVFSTLVYLSRKLLRIGKFAHSKDWKTVQKDWNANADPIDDFVSNYIVESEFNKGVRETYHFYKEIMLLKQERPLGIAQFGKAFREYFDQYTNKDLSGKTERVWLNIDFKRPRMTTLKEFQKDE